MKRIILFDFDGTIADTFQTTVDILRSLSTKYGYKKLSDGEVQAMKDLSIQAIFKELQVPFARDAVPLYGSELSHQASAAGGAGARSRLVDCAIGGASARVSSPAPFHPGARKGDNTRAKIDIIDTCSRSSFGQ